MDFTTLHYYLLTQTKCLGANIDDKSVCRRIEILISLNNLLVNSHTKSSLKWWVLLVYIFSDEPIFKIYQILYFRVSITGYFTSSRSQLIFFLFDTLYLLLKPFQISFLLYMFAICSWNTLQMSARLLFSVGVRRPLAMLNISGCK